MQAQTIQIDDLVRVKRRTRSVMIHVEKVEYVPKPYAHAPSGYVRISGVRIRQSDLAKISNIKRCELRRGYYYVPVESVTLVHRESDDAS